MKDNSATKISIHSIKNLLGNEAQQSFFSDHDKEFAEKHGITLMNNIDRFGVDLTDIQSRVMEGILRGFSETNYKGNINPQGKEEISDQYSGNIPETYKYINEIPRLRATQTQLLDWAGVNKNSIASVTRALEALNDLGTTQFCFYYDRLAFSKDGVPSADKDGKWKKEQVVAVDTLFTIKKVTQQNSETLSYYEITPSPIFLDQIEGYFILIPFKWREEVRKLVGNKKASAYTFRFLLFLRYQYELKRRSTNRNMNQIKWSPEEIAIAIKMPDSIYKRKKERRDEILENAYSVAKKLGYLSEYERFGYLDVLTFNDQKYSHMNSTKEAIEIDVADSEEYKNSNRLISLFIKCRKSLDPQYDIPPGPEKTGYIKDFCELLKQRSLQDIENIIEWAVTQKYWSTRLSSPGKLNKYFSEAWVEFTVSKSNSKEEKIKKNKQAAWDKLGHIHNRCESISYWAEGTSRLLLGNNGIEITCGNHTNFIDYSDKDFQLKMSDILERHRFPK
jgi:hypothetical protein